MLFFLSYLWSSIIPLDRSLKHTIAYDGTILFEFLKIIVTIQDSTLSGTRSNLFPEDESHLRESQRVDLSKETYAFILTSV